MSWPTRLVSCAPDRRAIFIPSTDCPRHNSVFVACRKSDHLQQLTDCPKDSLVFLVCRKTYHTRVSNMDRVSSSISASHSRPILCVYLPPGGFAMASPFVHFTEKEVQLLTRWRAEGKSVGEIASLLQRDKTTIRRQMKRARRCVLTGFLLWTIFFDPWTVGPSRGPFRGPLCFDRFSPVDRIF